MISAGQETKPVNMNTMPEICKNECSDECKDSGEEKIASRENFARDLARVRATEAQAWYEIFEGFRRINRRMDIFSDKVSERLRLRKLDTKKSKANKL